MHDIFSMTARQDVSIFRDIAQMHEISPTYLFNVLTELHTVVKNDC